MRRPCSLYSVPLPRDNSSSTFHQFSHLLDPSLDCSHLLTKQLKGKSFCVVSDWSYIISHLNKVIVQALGHMSLRHKAASAYRWPFVIAALLFSCGHLSQVTSRVSLGYHQPKWWIKTATAHILYGSPERPLTPKDSSCMSVGSIPIFPSNCLTTKVCKKKVWLNNHEYCFLFSEAKPRTMVCVTMMNC